LEELAILGGERLCKHLLAKEGSNAIEGLEVEGAVRKNLCELRVDLLHVTSQVLTKGAGAVDNILDARLDQELITDISVDKLEDGLLKGDLRLEVGTLEGRASLLYADARASTAQGLELELILGRSDEVRGGTDAAKGGVIDEGRGGEGSGGNCHFLDNATNDIRHIRKGAAVDCVDIGRLTSQYLCDLTNDAIYIFGSKVLDCSQGDTFLRHFVLVEFSL